MTWHDRIRSAVVYCIAVAGALLLSACADGANLPPPSFATNTGPGLEKAYRLSIGDKVKLTVFDEADLSGQFEINGRGNIVLPLIGEIQARDRTLRELQAAITRKLANGYVKNPRISVDVTNYRPIFVHGEVKSGGLFEYRNRLSFEDAVAMAGGYTYRAEKNYVILKRNGSTPVRVSLPSAITVLPGDNIRVAERFF